MYLFWSREIVTYSLTCISCWRPFKIMLLCLRWHSWCINDHLWSLQWLFVPSVVVCWLLKSHYCSLKCHFLVAWTCNCAFSIFPRLEFRFFPLKNFRFPLFLFISSPHLQAHQYISLVRFLPSHFFNGWIFYC